MVSMQSVEFRDVPMAGFDFDPHSTIIEDNGYIGEMVESIGDSVFHHSAASSRNCSSSCYPPPYQEE